MRAPQIIYIGAAPKSLILPSAVCGKAADLESRWDSNLALSAMALGITAAQHGQPRSGKENFWEMLLAIALHMGLLCWGGFFG